MYSPEASEMPSALSSLFGNRILPVTAPKSSLNPITRVAIVAERMEIAAITYEQREAPSPVGISQAARLSSYSLSCRPRRLSLQAFGVPSQPANGMSQWGGAAPTPPSSPANGAFGGVGVPGGGFEGGTGGVGMPSPGYVGIPEDYGQATSISDFDQAQVGFGAIAVPSAALPPPSKTPQVQAVSKEGKPVTIVPVAVSGLVYFSLVNGGHLPIKVSAEVYGRHGDHELFVTAVEKTLPQNSKPVSYRAQFALEGEDATEFVILLMEEYNKDKKATVVLDAVLRWRMFTHKVSDARAVDVTLDSVS